MSDDMETAIVGMDLLTGMRCSLRAFACIMRDDFSADYEVTTLITRLDQDLASLTAWTATVRGQCSDCVHYDAIYRRCQQQGWRTFPDSVCTKFERVLAR